MANVVITGANRGIGLALVRHYATGGHQVFAGCRAPLAATDLSLLADQTGRVTILPLDIADADSIAAFQSQVPAPIDILINNAGIMGGPHQSLDDIDYEAWMEAFRVMALGPFRVVKGFLPHLEQAAQPRIMTLSSMIAASTCPIPGYYIYASAKAAGNRVMQILAKDLAPRNIVVGYIHPGHVQTDMGGPGAAIPPDESAAAIARVTAGLSLANTGRFWNWTGEEHPL